MTVLERANSQRKPLNPLQLEQEELPLQRLYVCERERASQLLFTQPLRGGVAEWTWKSAMQEVRRVASWIEAQNWPPRSRIAILSKNSAWWLMADFAIWMSGHVSVPLFTASRDASLCTLFEHCEAVACFVGRLDHPLPLEEKVFGPLIFIAFPNIDAAHLPPGSVYWQNIVSTQEPLRGDPVRVATEVATLIYTSGTTGQPKGAMHSFQGLSMMGKSMEPAFGATPGRVDRILSYLPLAHIAERAIVEMNLLTMPMQVFFVENQETFLEDLRRSRCTLFFSIPRLYIRFQQGVFEKLPEKKLDLLLRIPVLRALRAYPQIVTR